jgi:hypothetical protein
MNALVALVIMYGDNIFLRNSGMVFEWVQHQEFAAT